jgi:hypothetical protein
MLRSYRTNLLARPPCGISTFEESWSAFIIDPIEQLQALADLLHRGLLSAAEFERQKTKIIGQD